MTEDVDWPSVTNALGRRIFFNAGDLRGRNLAASGGNLNPMSLELWRNALALADWSTIVDVGCNYGEMLLSVELPHAAQIVAFEPNQQILPYLRRTLGEFGRTVDLREVAVGDVEDSEAEFIADQEWSGTSGLASVVTEAPDHDHSVMTVSLSTLDIELGRLGQRSACIKIDVEGNEPAVLRGAQRILSSLPQWAIVVEVLHMPANEVDELAREHALYLIDKRTKKLVRVVGGDLTMTSRLLDGSWLYPQDALIVSSPELVRSSIQ